MIPDQTPPSQEGVTLATILGFFTAALAQLGFALKEWRSWKERVEELKTAERLFNIQEKRIDELVRRLGEVQSYKFELVEILRELAEHGENVPENLKSKIDMLKKKGDGN
jgi:biopolymer transport protein ExbB/TolQ